MGKIDIDKHERHWFNERAMKIALGTDHAGFQYKQKVKALLTSLGHEVKDCGTFNEDPVDYPVFIRPAAESVARGESERLFSAARVTGRR